jgi:PIN domain nuclease of toxin-antitoxin system
VIVLDTHIWFWWVQGDKKLKQHHLDFLNTSEEEGFGISVISCWEIAKFVAYKRVTLSVSVDQWLSNALDYPGMELLPLTPTIAVEANNLPGDFHRDPAVQIIVATARVYDCPLMTLDKKILDYPHVRTAPRKDAGEE